MADSSPTWLPRLERALSEADPAALAAIPKTDLHCHGLLSAPLQTYETILGRSLPRPPRVFGDFDEFNLYIVQHLFPALSDPVSIRAIIADTFQRMVSEGVVYAEMSFDLLLPEAIGQSVDQFAVMLGEEVGRVAPQLRVAPEIGVNRALPAADLDGRVRAFLDTGLFGSVDLYGDERIGDTRDFALLYELAAKRGLKRKGHAGELCGPQCVRESIEVLGLDVVHHGVRVVEDPATIDWIAERGTVLHVCPTSNYALRICESVEAHPARTLFAAGVALTVNTDDFTLFGASTCDELLNLARMGFTAAEIATVIQTGLAQEKR
jgi:adenosine deaminase